MPLAEHDHMVEALAAHGADEAFRKWILPGTARRRENFRDAHALDTMAERLAVDLVAIDFFTVPTARLRVLFVLVVLARHRRRVVHFNVTEHPTAAWTAQQIAQDDGTFKKAKIVFTESDERCGLTAELDGVKKEGVPLQLDLEQLEDAQTQPGARAQLKEALRLYFRKVMGK